MAEARRQDNGLRVQKVVTGTDAINTVYVRSGDQVIAEYDNGAAATSPTREYLYGNNLLAIVTGSTSGSGGTIVYQQRDHLSPRLFTNSGGSDIGEEGMFPFGESWYSSSQADGLLFTTYERDAESGNDYALARSYANTQGRFLLPDPLEGVVGDPQSWNRYVYVENDPINLTDPRGQGFWSDLGFAIADIFAIFLPEVIPELAVAQAGSQATANLVSLARFLSLTYPAWKAVAALGSGPPSFAPPNITPTCGGCGSGSGVGSSAGGGAGPGTAPGSADGGAQAGNQGPGSPSGHGVGAPGSWGAGGDGVAQQLHVTTVDPQASMYGEGALYFRWGLQKPSARGGIIVQHLTIQIPGKPVQEGWEAWEVPAGSRFTVEGTQYPNNWDDAWKLPPGSKDVASARFYEGMALPKSFVVGGFPLSVGLPSTSVNPHLSTANATKAVSRWAIFP